MKALLVDSPIPHPQATASGYEHEKCMHCQTFTISLTRLATAAKIEGDTSDGSDAILDNRFAATFTSSEVVVDNAKYCDTCASAGNAVLTVRLKNGIVNSGEAHAVG